jgi:hypothetical protein
VDAAAAAGGAPSALQQAMSLPLVKQVMDIFDAQVVGVRPEGEAAPPGPDPEATPRRPVDAEASPFTPDDEGSDVEEPE